jgi:hypothetical protein
LRQLLGNLIQRLGLIAENDDRAALVDEPARGCRADAGAATGDQRDGTRQAAGTGFVRHQGLHT